MTRWHDFSDSPSSTVVMSKRRHAVGSTRAAPVDNRVKYVAGLCRGKRVLDVGCVNHMTSAQFETSWLHKQIRDVASYCLGVDTVDKAVQDLRNAGYNVAVCDITRQSVDERFDVIVAGEVIGHLSDPSAVFKLGAKCLSPGGRLVITSPNPYYLNHMLTSIRGQSYWSADIVTLLTASGIVEMAERAGMRLVQWRGVRLEDSWNYPSSRKLRWLKRLRPLLLALGVTNESLCPTLIYEVDMPNHEVVDRIHADTPNA